MRIKSHKTVEQIAKKHRMDVSDIQNQLDMGVPIEHEHTRNKTLATDIALQHLDEIPDYYTRLKKMEASAKKEHKKFKDVKEDAVTDLQRGITELPDASYGSIDNLMRRIMKKRKMSAKQLHNDFVNKHNQTPDTWAKKNMKEETKSGDQGLRDWFGKSESKDKKPGWVNVVTGGTCASDEPGEGVPKCVSSQRRANMSKEERLTASRRKKAADPGQQEKSGAAKPTNVRTEEMDLQEVKDKPGKGSGKKDACYNKVKSRYDVWPSAYASGALVKCRKVGATNWGTKSEDCWDGYKQEGMKKKGKKMVPNCVPVNSESTDSLGGDWHTPIRERADRYCPKCEKLERRSECKYGAKYWDMFSLPAEVISSKKDYNITMPHPGNMPEEKDHEYSMARSEISTIISAVKRLKKKMKGEGNIEAWVQSKITKAADYIDTAADYVDSREMAKESHNPLKDPSTQIKKSSGAGALTPEAAKQLGPKAVELRKKKIAKVDLPKVNKESVTIEDSKGNTFLEIIDIIHPEKMKGISEDHEKEDYKKFDNAVNAAMALKDKKTRVKVLTHAAKNHPSKNKTFESFMIEAKKSEMKCNSPKSEPIGNSLTGKSHVVKACENGKEKLIRFGQRGVKGSPKKKGESKEYASRRHRFQTRHAKNIAKGKMSAAYWANKVKW